MKGFSAFPMRRLSRHWRLWAWAVRGHLTQSCNCISDSVDRMTSNLKTMQYFIKKKLTLHLYNILGIVSLKFEINRLYILWTMASRSVASLLTKRGSWWATSPARWRYLLQVEPVWTLKLSNHSQLNLYDEKEESFLFLISVNIMCKASLIMEKYTLWHTGLVIRPWRLHHGYARRSQLRWPRSIIYFFHFYIIRFGDR